LGGRTAVGGGGLGGVAGTPTATGPGTPGTSGLDGSWNGVIGGGGGGGAGGVGKYGGGGTTCNAATTGGRGAFNTNDLSAYAPGDTPSPDPASGSLNVISGGAGGAKAALVNGLPYIYGSSKGAPLPGDPGIVIVRLTAM
jgi:hypothetical protein